MRPSDVADRVLLTTSGITRLMDRVEQRGLIERRATADDRRCVIVALSEKGAGLVDQFRQSRRDIFSRAIADLSETDRRLVIELLGKVVKALESYETSAVQGQGLNSRVKKQKNSQ